MLWSRHGGEWPALWSSEAGPCTMLDERARLRGLGRRIHDEGSVGDRPYCDCLFEETPVEPKSKLVKIALKMARLYNPLMGAEQPPLNEAGHAGAPGTGTCALTPEPAIGRGLCTYSLPTADGYGTHPSVITTEPGST